jgi:6-phosphogluconate dehydrogenase
MASLMILFCLQNLALNVADKGFSISVYNRSYDKTEAAVKRAAKEGKLLLLPLYIFSFIPLIITSPRYLRSG